MRESEIQSKIIKYLESKDWIVVKIIQTNKNGWPDLQAHKDGQTIFIEVKGPNGRLSELQKYRLKKLQEKGDRKSTRLNSSHVSESRMPSSA